MNKLSILKDRAKHAIDRFVDHYKDAYIRYYVQSIKDSYHPEERHHFLLDGPLDKTDIWAGWLKVADGDGKKWKDCYCYVRYNYCIQCFAAECVEPTEEVPKPKQPKMLYEIFPKGLKLKQGEKVKPATPADNAIWFKHKRRVNYYLAPHEKTGDWEPVLQVIDIAAKNALAPLNPNPVSRKAFDYAYKWTRWWYLPWGAINIEAPEKETFGMLVYEIVMHLSVDDIPGGGFMRKMVDKSIRKFIETNCGVAWAAISSTIDGIAEALRPTITEQLEPLATLETTIKVKVDELVMEKVTEMTQEKISPFLAKMVGVIRAPVVEGYKIFMAAMEKDLAKAVETIREGGDVKKTCHDIEYKYRYSGWRGMREASDKIDEIWAPVTENRSLYPHMWCYWDFVRNANKRLCKLAKRAASTLQILIQEKCRDGTVTPPAVAEECLEPTLKWLRHDLGYECRNYFETRLFKVFWAPIEETLLKLLKEIVSPLADAIPAPINTFLNINTILEDILTKFIMDLCVSGVDLSLKSDLDEYEVEDMPEPMVVEAPPVA